MLKATVVLLLAMLLMVSSPLQVYAHMPNHHRDLTKEAAQEEGYSNDAIDELKEGNLEIDKHQGTEPGDPDNPGTNAHGTTSPGQSKADAKKGAEEFKEAKMNKAIDELQGGDVMQALEELGKGTHTVQDELQHRFGVWRGWWSWWNLTVVYALWFYGSLAVHGVRDVVLTDDERRKNVTATRDYLKEFERKFLERCREVGKSQEYCQKLLRSLKQWKRPGSEPVKISPKQVRSN